MKRYEIKLESEARLELEKQLKLHTTEYRLAERAKIILLSADGMSLEAIASKLDCSQRRICKWRRRYCENGLAGLQEMQRPGRPCTISPETVEKVITGRRQRRSSILLSPNGSCNGYIPVNRATDLGKK